MNIWEQIKNILNLIFGGGMDAEEAFWQNIKYFTKDEFADNKGDCWINQDLVIKLDTARFYAGVPFVLNSKCRNPEQNEQAGGSPTSSHLKGFAVDISAKTSDIRFTILSCLIRAGFTRIGVKETFIHVDNDPDKPAGVLWMYNK